MHERMKIVGRRLGKHPKKHDNRNLKFAKYAASLPTPPNTVDWGTKVASWGEMLNSSLGDCTCAGAGHMIQAWTADNGAQIVPSDDDILTAYEAVSGYDPKTGQNDNGAVELEVLNYWRNIGIAGHRINAYAEIECSVSQTIQRLKEAIWLFGGVYTGVALPVSAQGQSVWDVPAGGLGGNGAPGGWGGHCVPLIAYDDSTFTCITWGARLKMTYAFVMAYMDEAYALLSPDWVSNNPAPSGFDLAALTADLAAL